MKTILIRSRNFFPAVIVLTAFVVLTSCENDNNDADSRTQWLGNWTCNETSGDFAPQTYQVNFSEGAEMDAVLIRGLYNEGSTFQLRATVFGRNLTIPQQTEDGIAVSGSASINNSGNRIDFDFIANDGSGNDIVSGYMVR